MVLGSWTIWGLDAADSGQSVGRAQEDRMADVTATTIKIIDPWEDGKKIQAKENSNKFCFPAPFILACSWEACPV